MTRLAGKIAVVTGSGIGIGAAIAERFAREGAFVYVTDINGETAQQTVARIKAAGGKAADAVVDVSKGQDVTALVRRIANEHGKADILVNNAGILVRGEIRNLTDAEWTRLREVNVDGVLRLSRDALPILRKGQNPSIINISSIMANRGLRPLAAYTATKGAVTALTKGLAVEYAPFNVRVNAISPGYVPIGRRWNLGPWPNSVAIIAIRTRGNFRPSVASMTATFTASIGSPPRTSVWPPTSPSGFATTPSLTPISSKKRFAA